METAAVAALSKLDGVLPARLRERVDAVQTGTVQLPGPDVPRIDTDVLVTLARGCRHTEGLRFGYTDNHGAVSARSVEPLRVVHTGRRWYLVARDRDRDAWRTFRVDRIVVARADRAAIHAGRPARSGGAGVGGHGGRAVLGDRRRSSCSPRTTGCAA